MIKLERVLGWGTTADSTAGEGDRGGNKHAGQTEFK